MREFGRQKPGMPLERARIAPERAEAQRWTITPPENESPLERKINAFTSIDGKKDYRAFYKIAYTIHERCTPPAEDWAERFWRDIDSVPEETRNDLFFIGLMKAVYNELERQARKIKDKQNS